MKVVEQIDLLWKWKDYHEFWLGKVINNNEERKKEIEELSESVEALQTYKTQVKVSLSLCVGLFGTFLTILGIYVSSVERREIE